MANSECDLSAFFAAFVEMQREAITFFFSQCSKYSHFKYVGVCFVESTMVVVPLYSDVIPSDYDFVHINPYYNGRNKEK